MAKIDRLAKLFHALADADLNRAVAAATDIVNDEDKGRRFGAARRLRSALRHNGVAAKELSTHDGTAGVMASVLTPLDTTVALDDVILPKQLRNELHSIVHEWHNRANLKRYRLAHRSRLLFHGPPGCGKSVTAAALARELSLPAYVVRFDAVIGAYLGQTATHLRNIFAFSERSPSVIVLDELDALGKRRGNPLDVGELDRIVIALMQELEHSHPQGLLVATSNLPKHLDDALWRRFDYVAQFPKPSKTQLEMFSEQATSTFGIKVNAAAKSAIVKSKSFAEAKQIIEGEARRIALAKD